jgi:hypothetical protein
MRTPNESRPIYERGRDELPQERVQDSYKARGKLHDPTRCPVCSAVFHKGRWTWGTAPAGTEAHLCPACHRIQDGCPAGYVTLSGAFFRQHREEILSLVRHCEARESAQHALERIMGIEDVAGGVLITTTDTHMARCLGETVHAAQKGQVRYLYSPTDHLLRVSWSR